MSKVSLFLSASGACLSGVASQEGCDENDCSMRRPPFDGRRIAWEKKPGADRYAIGPPAVQAEEEEDDSCLVGIFNIPSLQMEFECTSIPHQNQDSLWKTEPFWMAAFQGLISWPLGAIETTKGLVLAELV